MKPIDERFANALKNPDVTDLRACLEDGYGAESKPGGRPFVHPPMQIALNAGNVPAVDELVRAGADIKQPIDGKPVLTYLCGRTSAPPAAMVYRLIELGADIEARDRYGNTALMEAASRGHCEVARILIGAGADIHSRNDHGGSTALWIALREGKADFVRILIEAGADVGSVDKHNRSALMFAAEVGHSEVVRLLIDAGADVHAESAEGKSAITYAAESRWHRTDDVIEMLARAGAKPTVGHLLDAVQRRNLPNIRALVRVGVDINGCEEKRGTPLMLAAAEGNAAFVRTLLRMGADANLEKAHRTALSLADRVEVVQALLESGAHLGSLDGSEPVAKACLLLDRGAKLPASAASQLLELAVKRSSIPLAVRLLERGSVKIGAKSYYLSRSSLMIRLPDFLGRIARANPSLVQRVTSSDEEIQSLLQRVEESFAAKSNEGGSSIAKLEDLPFDLARAANDRTQRQWPSLDTPVLPADAPAKIHWAEGERERVLDARRREAGTEASDARLDKVAGGLLKGEWPEDDFEAGDLVWALASHGQAVLPPMFDNVSYRWRRSLAVDSLVIEALLHIEHPRLAINMAALALADVHPRPLSFEKHQHDSAWRLGLRWLTRYPTTAALGLLPLALMPREPNRKLARAGLKLLAAQPRGIDAIREAVAALGNDLPDSARDFLNDPENWPSWESAQRLPPEWLPRAHPRPILATSGKALPDEAIDALAMAMTRSDSVMPDPMLLRVKLACTSESLADFAWSVFESWLSTADAMRSDWTSSQIYKRQAPRFEWMFSTLRYLGDDHCARRLTPYIRIWPRSNYRLRAIRGLEILAAIGTDVALAELQSLCFRNRYTGREAEQILNAVAEERGLTREQLDDRVVPSLGLDQAGQLRIDVGGAECIVSIDEQFLPCLRVGDAPVQRKWPKRIDGSEPKQLADGAKHWKAFCSDLKLVARLQVARLERAMLTSRRWSAQGFMSACVGHPLLGAPVRGLVWGRYGPDGDALNGSFIVASPDGELQDLEGQVITLEPQERVGIVHPLELGSSLEAWHARWKTLRRGQPISQLSRKVYRCEDDVDGTLFGLQGAIVPHGAFRALDAQGWRKSMLGIAGWVDGFTKTIGAREVSITVEPGLHIVETGFEDKEQTLTVEKLPPLNRVEYSELVRELQALRQ